MNQGIKTWFLGGRKRSEDPSTYVEAEVTGIIVPRVADPFPLCSLCGPTAQSGSPGSGTVSGICSSWSGTLKNNGSLERRNLRLDQNFHGLLNQRVPDRAESGAARLSRAPREVVARCRPPPPPPPPPIIRARSGAAPTGHTCFSCQVHSGRCGSVTAVTAPSGPVHTVGRRV